MGCDRKGKLVSVEGQINFNPRIPYGMRPSAINALRNLAAFQSTHPVWDATVTVPQPVLSLVLISIHASRMGCDRVRLADTGDTEVNFNPRIPYGMRQRKH